MSPLILSLEHEINCVYKGLPVKITHELRHFSRIVLRLLFVRFSFGSRSVLVRFSFGSRSVLVRFSIGSRSILVHPSFILRSSSVHSPFGNRRLIEERSKNERRIIGGKTEMYRNSNGKPRERRPEQKLYFYHLNSNYYGKTYS